MANCRDCNAFVVFLKKPDGSFFPPFDPVTDVDLGDFFVASEYGIGSAAPQLYRKHRCVTPEERLRLQQEREAERQRLIEADRERRRIARETQEALEAEQARRKAEAEEDRIALEAAEAADDPSQQEWFEPEYEEMPLKVALNVRRKWLRTAYREDANRASHFQFSHHASRLRKLPCDNCGAKPNEPCWKSEHPSDLELLGEDLGTRLGLVAADRYNRIYVSRPTWFADRVCSARWVNAPALPRVRHRPAFHEEDCPEWPPPADYYSGRADMAEFLMQNVDIFNVGSDASPDAFRKPRRFLTGAEVEEMSGWLRENGPILWEPSGPTVVSPGDYERWIDDGGRVAGGVDEAKGEAGGPPCDRGGALWGEVPVPHREVLPQ